MIIGVFGPGHFKGHEYKNYDHVASILEFYESASKYITGGGVGVEQLALRFATSKELQCETIPPDLRNGSIRSYEAFRNRNREIIRAVDMIVLLWDGKGRFYCDFLEDVLEAHKTVHLYPIL